MELEFELEEKKLALEELGLPKHSRYFIIKRKGLRIGNLTLTDAEPYKDKEPTTLTLK